MLGANSFYTTNVEDVKLLVVSILLVSIKAVLNPESSSCPHWSILGLDSGIFC